MLSSMIDGKADESTLSRVIASVACVSSEKGIDDGAATAATAAAAGAGAEAKGWEGNGGCEAVGGAAGKMAEGIVLSKRAIAGIDQLLGQSGQREREEGQDDDSVSGAVSGNAGPTGASGCGRMLEIETLTTARMLVNRSLRQVRVIVEALEMEKKRQRLQVTRSACANTRAVTPLTHEVHTPTPTHTHTHKHIKCT